MKQLFLISKQGEKKRRNILLFFIAFFILLTIKVSAQTIKVADIATARATYASGASYNLNGALMTNALAKLTNTNNFGATGTVAHSLIITQAFGSSGSITVAALNSYDILFIPFVSTNTPLTTSEITAIYTWSQQAGKVVICAEQSGYSPYSTKSGFAIQNGSLNPTLPVATGDNLFNLFSGGVFGNAGSDGLVQAGSAQGYFSADCYSTIIGKDANSHTAVIFNGKTRDMYFADGGFFTTQTLTGMSSGGAITNSTDKVWANTWAWAINEVLTAPVTPPTEITATTTVGCTTSASGSLTFISPLGNNTLGEAYNYSINGTNFQTSPTFSGLSAGTYTIYAKSTSCPVISGTSLIVVDPAAAPTLATVVQPTCALGTGTVNLSGLPSSGNWTVTRSGTSTATLTGSGSTYANAGITPGTYTYTVTNANGCTSSSTNSAILALPTGYASAPLLAANAVSKLLTLPTCVDVNGYIQFVDPSNTSNKYLAINPNGNTGYSFTVTAINNNPTIANQKKTDGSANTTALANRMYTVVDAGSNSYNVNGGMVVRIYYSAGDSTAARAGLDAAVTSGSYSGKWFKLSGTASNILSAQTATGITGAIYPTATYGTESGISFVELRGITSFSTFGFLEKRGQSILPVSIKNFTANINNCSAILSWQTSFEQNSATYEVETSTDGINFSKVGEVKSKNIVSGASYNFVNNSLANGINYFRLKAMDIDGQYTYSEIVLVTSYCMGGGNISVSPNPVKNTLKVIGLTNGSHVSLFDSNNKKLTETTATSANQNINMTDYTSGIYILHVSNIDGTVSNIKVVKD